MPGQVPALPYERMELLPKRKYIRLPHEAYANPVRAGSVENADDWPWMERGRWQGSVLLGGTGLPK